MKVKLDGDFFRKYLNESNLGLEYINHRMMSDKIDVYAYRADNLMEKGSGSELLVVDIPVYGKNICVHIMNCENSTDIEGIDNIVDGKYCTYRYAAWIKDNHGDDEIALPVTAIGSLGEGDFKISVDSFYNDVAMTNKSILLNRYIIRDYLTLIKSIRLYVISGHTVEDAAERFGTTVEFASKAMREFISIYEAKEKVKNYFQTITGNDNYRGMYDNYYNSLDSFCKAIDDLKVNDGVYETGVYKLSAVEKCNYGDYINSKHLEDVQGGTDMNVDSALLNSKNSDINTVLKSEVAKNRDITTKDGTIQMEVAKVCIKVGIRNKVKCKLCGNYTVLDGYVVKDYIAEGNNNTYIVNILVPKYKCIVKSCGLVSEEYPVDVRDVINHDVYRVATLDDYCKNGFTGSNASEIETPDSGDKNKTEDSVVVAQETQEQAQDIVSENSTDVDDKTSTNEDVLKDENNTREDNVMKSGDIVKVGGEEFEILGDEYNALFFSTDNVSEPVTATNQAEVCEVKQDKTAKTGKKLVKTDTSVKDTKTKKADSDKDASRGDVELYWNTYSNTNINAIDYVKRVVSGVLHFRRAKNLDVSDESIKRQLYSDIREIAASQYKNRYVKVDLKDEFGLKLRGYEDEVIALIDDGMSPKEAYTKMCKTKLIMTELNFLCKVEKEASLRASLRYLAQKYSKCMTVSGYEVSIDMDNTYQYEFDSVCKPEHGEDNGDIDDNVEVVEDYSDVVFIKHGDKYTGSPDTVDAVDVEPVQMSFDDLDGDRSGEDMSESKNIEEVVLDDGYSVEDYGYEPEGAGNVEYIDADIDDDSDDDDEAVVVFTNPTKAIEAAKTTSLARRVRTVFTDQLAQDYVSSLDKNLRCIDYTEDDDCVYINALTRIKPPKLDKPDDEGGVYSADDLLRVCNPIKMRDLPIGGKNVVITLVNNNMYYVGGKEDAKIRNSNKFIERRFKDNYTTRLMNAVLEDLTKLRSGEYVAISDITPDDVEEYLNKSKDTKSNIKMSKTAPWKVDKHTEQEIISMVNRVYGDVNVVYASDREDSQSGEVKTHVWIAQVKGYDDLCDCGSNHVEYGDYTESIVTLPEIAGEYEVYAEYRVGKCLDCGASLDGMGIRRGGIVHQQSYLNYLDAQKRKFEHSVEKACSGLQEIKLESGFVSIVESLSLTKRCFEEHVNMVKNMVKLSSGVYIARLDRLMRECEEAIGVCDENINNIINSSIDTECQSCNPGVNGNLGGNIRSSLDITQLENIDWVFDLKKISIEANQKAKRETIKSLENSLNTIIEHIQYMKDIDIDTEVLSVKKMVYDIYIRERTVELNLSGITLSDISGILKIPESTTGYYNRKRDSLYNDERYKKIARHKDVMNYYFEGNSPEQIVEIFGREGYTRKLESIYEVLKCEKTWCVNMRKAIEIVLNNLNKELI